MKLKNVVIGSEIEAKRDTRFFKKGDLVKVMAKEYDDYFGEMTLNIMDSDGDTLWVNHRYFRRPRPKKLDQSIFDGVDEEWRFVAVNVSGALILSTHPIEAMSGSWVRKRNEGKLTNHGFGYDTTNWQNSLIERESKELTGSELCKAMIERGDKYVMCLVGTHNDAVVIEGMHDNNFIAVGMRNLYSNPKPISNQGEPLTAKDVGL